MQGFHIKCAVIFIGIVFPVKLISTPVTEIENSFEQNDEIEDSGLTCDPLAIEGTAILCFPPNETNSRDCSQRSVPGTIASYSCRNFKGEVYTGFLNCAKTGIWIISLFHANNSLCNLDASIVNLAIPDVVIADDIPEFTTPNPNQDLQAEFPLKDYEKVALQLHNTFRENHGSPKVQMTEQLNSLAQNIVDSIISSDDIEDLPSNLKLTPIRRTMNLEMNWYFQFPSSPNLVEATSNAVQVWYSGFRKYDWEHLENNLEMGDALAFSRVVWKATQLIGIGVANSHNITFVACVYTPARNVLSVDPLQEFRNNVPHFRIGLAATMQQDYIFGVVLLIITSLAIKCSTAAYSRSKYFKGQTEKGTSVDFDTEVFNLLTTSLSNEQCILIFIYLGKVEISKTSNLNNNLPSLEEGVNDIIAERSELLRSPKWKFFGQTKCLSSMKEWARKMRGNELIDSDVEMKSVILNGLTLLNRTDLSPKISSILNRRRSQKMSEALQEINRHRQANETFYNSTSSSSSNQDEFQYEIIIILMIVFVAVALIIVKSLTSFQSRTVVVSNFRGRRSRNY